MNSVNQWSQEEVMTLMKTMAPFLQPCRVPISSHQLCNKYSFCAACPEHNTVRILHCGVYKRIKRTNVLLDNEAYVIGYRSKDQIKLEQNDEVRSICQRYNLCFRQS
jgi:hypothetical protein